MGTALVFLAILAGIVVVSGISWRIILPVVLAFATGLALFVMVFTTDWGKEAMLKMGCKPTRLTVSQLGWIPSLMQMVSPFNRPKG